MQARGNFTLIPRPHVTVVEDTFDAEVLVAGGANTPRFVEHAIRDGHRVGRSV